MDDSEVRRLIERKTYIAIFTNSSKKVVDSNHTMMILYCNKCFRLRELETNLQLVFSECGHVFCQSCASSKCAICTRPFNPVSIDRFMPASMAIYFEKPSKFYQCFLKVMKFQIEQQAQFFDDGINKLPKQMSKLEKQLAGMEKLEERLDQKLKNEKERIEKLKAFIGNHEQKRHLEPMEASKHCRVSKGGQRRSSNDCASISSPTSSWRHYPQNPTLSLSDSSNKGGGSVYNAKMHSGFPM